MSGSSCHKNMKTWWLLQQVWSCFSSLRSITAQQLFLDIYTRLQKDKQINEPGFSEIFNTDSKTIWCLSNNTISSSYKTIRLFAWLQNWKPHNSLHAYNKSNKNNICDEIKKMELHTSRVGGTMYSYTSNWLSHSSLQTPVLTLEQRVVCIKSAEVTSSFWVRASNKGFLFLQNFKTHDRDFSN